MKADAIRSIMYLLPWEPVVNLAQKRNKSRETRKIFAGKSNEENLIKREREKKNALKIHRTFDFVKKTHAACTNQKRLSARNSKMFTFTLTRKCDTEYNI